jgi:hypothetical protein
MPTKKELYAKAKEYGVKGISRMTKHELEEAVIYVAQLLGLMILLEIKLPYTRIMKLRLRC